MLLTGQSTVKEFCLSTRLCTLSKLLGR